MVKEVVRPLFLAALGCRAGLRNLGPTFFTVYVQHEVFMNNLTYCKVNLPDFLRTTLRRPVEVSPPGFGEVKVPSLVEVVNFLVRAPERSHSIRHIHLQEVNPVQ